MSVTHCDVHQVPWKWVPAGVSTRTGKPYPAFQRCPVDECQARPPRNARGAAQPPAENMPTPLPVPQLPPLKSASLASLAQTAINAACSFYRGSSVSPATVMETASQFFHLWLVPASEGKAPKPDDQEIEFP